MTSASALRLVALATLAGWQMQAACLPDGVQPSGAKYRICMPNGTWNRNLVVYAHGYVAYNKPIAIPEDQLTLPDGTSLPDLITGLGFAFAVSSYSSNGLAIQEGVNDLVELVSMFQTLSPQGGSDKVFLVGPSEGGIVTALSIERYPNIYRGGVAACGPIGSFQTQINYLGNFRVLFDYFFPGVIPGNVLAIPQEVIDNWETTYVPKIRAAIAANQSATTQLLRVSKAPFDSADPATIAETVENVLWYSAFTTNDASTKLGGQPFDNRGTIYLGSSNDLLLNLLVKRFAPDQAAINEMKAKYETSGILARPLVTLHTTGDPIIPYWHEPFYGLKTFVNGTSSLHNNIPVGRYGHCNFNALEALIAFGVMLIKDATLPSQTTMESVLPPAQRAEFRTRAAAAGLPVKP